MYAVIGRANLDANRADEAAQVLRDKLLPQVKQLEGFSGGTWTRTLDREKGVSIVLFETEEAARAALKQAAEMAPPAGSPLSFGQFDVAEVVVKV